MPYARYRVWQDEPRRELQRFFDSYFATEGSLEAVLDAGAGYEMPLDIPLDVHLVAIDASQDALAKNRNADEKILGDIQTHQLPREAFDAVICWWVLEHLPRPADAITRFAAALRPGGLLVIGVPYFWGFKALATKATPYSFHVWFARRSDPAAGSPGVGPYRTFLRRDLAPRPLARLARAHRLDVAFSRTVSMNPEQRLPRPLQITWRALGATIRSTTFGRYDPLLSEHIAVFKKSA